MPPRKMRYFGEPLIVVCVITIFTGSGMLGYAVWLQNVYNNAPTKTIDRNLEGFFVMENETGISDDYLGMIIVLQPPTLYVEHAVELEQNGTYNFVLCFPFRIREINQTSSVPIKSEFELDNNGTKGSSVSISLVRQEGSVNITETVGASFSIEETFVSGRRGTYFANIRFTYFGALGTILLNSPWINRTEWLPKYLGPVPMPVKNFFLIFMYPERISVTQASPDFTIGPSGFPSSNAMPNMTSLTWYYQEMNSSDFSIVIHFTDNPEYDSYQQTLFNSGLWYGLGPTIMITSLFELGRKIIETRRLRRD
jgi:hypothetical protein